MDAIIVESPPFDMRFAGANFKQSGKISVHIDSMTQNMENTVPYSFQNRS